MEDDGAKRNFININDLRPPRTDARRRIHLPTRTRRLAQAPRRRMRSWERESKSNRGLSGADPCGARPGCFRLIGKEYFTRQTTFYSTARPGCSRM